MRRKLGLELSIGRRFNMLVKVERIHVTFEGNEIAQTLRTPENPQTPESQGTSCASASSPA